MRLIDADDAIRKMESTMDMQELYLPVHFKELVIDECPTIDAVPRQKYEEDMENAFAHGYTDSESNFRKMIADGELVEVVRCKDCIHFDSEDDCDCPMDVRYSDFFCSYGEEKGEPMGDIIRCKSCVWYTKIDKNTGVCVWRLEPKTKNSSCPEWMPKERRTDGNNGRT